MRQLAIVCIALAAGAAGGVVHGAANLALAEPFLDRAIESENMALFESGLADDTVEFRAQFDQYRAWQKGGQVLAGAILGAGYGALFGIVYALSRHALPGRHDAVKALGAGRGHVDRRVPCAVCKVPGRAARIGRPVDGRRARRAVRRVRAVSGAAAVGAHRSYGALRRLAGAAGGGRGGASAAAAAAGALALYAAAVLAAGAALPGSDGQVGSWWGGGGGGGAGAEGSAALAEAEIEAFRAASAAGTAVFWAATALFMGAMWGRARPDLAAP